MYLSLSQKLGIFDSSLVRGSQDTITPGEGREWNGEEERRAYLSLRRLRRQDTIGPGEGRKGCGILSLY